jgi:hypothetical protein
MGYHRRDCTRARKFQEIRQTNYWVCIMSNGWTLERRERQAALIRGWRPWTLSTGPKTDGGKAASAMNARRHGMRSRRALDEVRMLRALIRQCGDVARDV